MPGGLPAAVSYGFQYSDTQESCGLPIGDGNGYVALQRWEGSHPDWRLISPSGQQNGGIQFWHGELWHDPSGFIGYSGSSTEQTVVVQSFDDAGKMTGTASIHGFGNFARNPNGGLFLVGRFSFSQTAPAPDSPRAVFMFDANAHLRYGPTPLGTNAAIFGQGVDLLGRAIVIVDGSSRFGPGSIGGIWFDSSGAPLTGMFQVLSGFTPGANTWFETAPLIDGGLALRRMDAGAGSAEVSSQWLAFLPSGQARADAAPGWLRDRPDTQLELARSRTAYALLPWAADASPCSQQVEVVSPAGNSCGKLQFPIDDGACRTRELRLGLDGTVMQMLPHDREPHPPNTTVYTCAVRFWPGALR